MYLTVPTRDSIKSHISLAENSTHHRNNSRKEQYPHKVCIHPFIVLQSEEYSTSFGIHSASIHLKVKCREETLVYHSEFSRQEEWQNNQDPSKKVLLVRKQYLDDQDAYPLSLIGRVHRKI